ncbi:MAG: two-component regulator propeller domain-containing protein [Paludibacter sp.]|nr:two-component regulator propeller domain-containing protein [Paludibacter sp.]
MLKYHIKYYISILTLSFVCIVNAQNYTFRALTMDDGLSNFVVNSFYKDSFGFLWIGTDNCLDRFDGVDIKHYTFNSVDVNKKRVLAIAESSAGQIWAGNALGLWKLNLNTNIMELFSPETIDCAVTALKWDSKSDVLYVGTVKGLYIVSKEQIQHIALNSNILSPGNHISGIFLSKLGLIWLATWKGLCAYNPANQSKIIYDYKASRDLNTFNKLTGIGSTIYLGTLNAGVVSFNTVNKNFSSFINVGCDIITDISSDGKDKIYVATDGNGIHFLSKKSNSIIESIRYNPKNKVGIRSNSVYSLLVDREGIIWVGFYQAGLDYSLYQNNLFKVYNFPPYFDSRDLHVRSFIIRGKDKVIGTREGLYYIQEDKKQVSCFNKSELRSNLILSLCYYKGDYYIGTYGGGVSILNPNTKKISKLSNDATLLKGHIFHFEEDTNGNLWIATSGGLYLYNKDTNELKLFNSTNSQLLTGNVYYVFFDSTKKGWIATDTGLCIYDPASQSIQSNVFPSGFFNNERIKVIHEDSHHQLYFSPDKGNIFASDVNMTRFSSLKMTKHFQNNIFMSMLEDKKGRYWFGCENGLISMTGKDDSYHSFGFSDGIPDPVFSCDAAYQDSNGLLWFGNAKGLLYVNLSQVDYFKQCPYPVIITNLKANGSDFKFISKINTSINNTIKLKHNQNNLTIRFVSLLYTNPGTIIFEYKLEGKDDNWLLLSGQNEVTYGDLPAGNYVFKVRMQGNKDSETQLHIQISSLFSLTFWIISILFACMIWYFTPRAWKIFKDKILSNEMLTLEKYKQQTMLAIDESKTDEKYKNTKLSEKECQLICDKLFSYIENEKPYTNPELKIVDIAQAINCSSHSLSYIFNQYLTKNYYDFINEYRIKEFKLLISDENFSKYTLSALAERCGFSSRASFFRSFKKLTRITPNEYIRSIGRNIHDLDDELPINS